MRIDLAYHLQLSLLLVSRKIGLRAYLNAAFEQPVAVVGRRGIAHVIDQRR